MSEENDPILGETPSNKVSKDIDDAIIKAGGIGKFQVYSFFIIVMGMVSGAFWLYSLQYFERVPQEWYCYNQVTSEWESCTLD
jgi:hypothetical protein